MEFILEYVDEPVALPVTARDPDYTKREKPDFFYLTSREQDTLRRLIKAKKDLIKPVTGSTDVYSATKAKLKADIAKMNEKAKQKAYTAKIHHQAMIREEEGKRRRKEEKKALTIKRNMMKKEK